MKLIKRCEICGSNDFKFLFEGKDKLLEVPGRFNVVECDNCNVQFLNPQPSYEKLGPYYDNKKYYSLKKIDKHSYKTKLKLFLYNLYFSEPNKNYFCRLFFSPIKFMVRKTIIKESKKLLDIGCGSGQFLYEMQQCGLDVHGIEIGKLNKKHAKILNILNSDLINAQYPNNFFDIITMNHVFEHLGNPNETLHEIYRILKDNGTFIIGVPNTRSLANKLFKKNWLAYDIPRHLFNYSDGLMINFLGKNKFKIKEVRYNSRPSQFVMSLYFLFNIKKRTGLINSFLEIFFVPLTLLVNFLKLGDQVEIMCIK